MSVLAASASKSRLTAASAALRSFSSASSAAVSCGERGGGSSAASARDEMFELRSGGGAGRRGAVGHPRLGPLRAKRASSPASPPTHSTPSSAETTPGRRGRRRACRAADATLARIRQVVDARDGRRRGRCAPLWLIRRAMSLFRVSIFVSRNDWRDSRRHTASSVTFVSNMVRNSPERRVGRSASVLLVEQGGDRWLFAREAPSCCSCAPERP